MNVEMNNKKKMTKHAKKVKTFEKQFFEFFFPFYFSYSILLFVFLSPEGERAFFVYARVRFPRRAINAPKKLYKNKRML